MGAQLPPGFTIDNPGPIRMDFGFNPDTGRIVPAPEGEAQQGATALPPGFVLDAHPAAEAPPVQLPPNPEPPVVPGAGVPTGYKEPDLAEHALSALKGAGVGTQGVARGVGDLLGAPVDLATVAINAGAYGAEKGLQGVRGAANMATGDAFGTDPIHLPRIEHPFLGSQDFADAGSAVADAAGIPLVNPDELPFSAKLGYEANRFGANSLATGLGVLRPLAMDRAAQVNRAPRTLDPLLAPYEDGSTKALVGDTAAGAGAGSAVAAADQYLPEQAKGPLTTFVASLLGGRGGATAARLATAPKAAMDALESLKPEPALPYLEDTPATASTKPGMIPVTKGAADRAARFVQGQSDHPAVSAKTVQEGAQSFRDQGLPVPTTGTLSKDVGLGAVEQGDRVRNPVAYQRKDQQIRTAASDQLQSVAPVNAEPRVATEFANKDAATRRRVSDTYLSQAREEADRGVKAANEQSLAELAAASAQGVNRVSTARTANEAAVAEVTKRAEEATKAAQSVAAPYREPANPQATSRTLDDIVVDQTMRPRMAEKNAKFAAIPDAERDVTPMVEAAAKVRETLGALNNPSAILPEGTLKRIEALAPRTVETPGEPATFKVDPQGVSEKVSGGPVIEKTGGTVSFQDLNKLRPELTDAVMAARKAGNYTLADNLKALKREINNEAERMAASGNPEAKDALSYFKDEFAPYFGQGTTGGDLRKGINGDVNRHATPPSGTAARFLFTGDGSKEAAADLRKILEIAPDPEAGNRAARSYILADLAKTVDANGTIDPRRLKDYMAKRADMLSEFPAVDTELQKLRQDVVNSRSKSNATAIELKKAVLAAKEGNSIAQAEAKAAIAGAQKAGKAAVSSAEASGARQIESAGDAQRLTEKDIQNGNLSLLLDSAPDVAVAKVFGANDPQTAMRGIAKSLSKDKAAAQGWKKAVSEYLVKKLTGTNTQMTDSGDAPVQYAAMSKMLRDHRSTLAEAFSPDEMNALQKAQKLLEPFGALSRRATVGSPTAENHSVAWRTLEAGMKAYFGVLKGGGIMRSVKLAASTLPDNNREVDLLIHKFQFDPEVAVHLLNRPLSEVGTPAWNSKLNRLLGYEAASREDTKDTK